jgi:ADP-heptose:LPS heptosyltransferase
VSGRRTEISSQPTGLPVSVEALQKADRFLFAPLCFVLTMLRRVSREPDSSEIPHPRSLLFVKLAEQGSTVLAARAIRQAREWVGRENLYFLVFQDNRFVLDVMDLVPTENVFTIPTNSLRAMVFGASHALRQIRRRQIDAAVDFEFFARFSAALTWLTKARWRAGMHAFFGEGPFRGDLFTHRVLYNPHIHTSAMFVSLVEALMRPARQLPTLDFRSNSATSEVEPVFVASAEEVARVKGILQQKGRLSEEARLILLNPNAGDLLPLRRWPLERYSALARRILERLPDVRVVFTGLKSEAAAADALVQVVDSPRCFSLAGMTTLRELLVLYSLSEVLVTNDSGPAHFAALAPINVVTLFGPETPSLFAASTPRNTVIFRGLACSPCVSALNNRQSVCNDNQCMKQISVEQVLDAVIAAYGRRVVQSSTAAW